MSTLEHLIHFTKLSTAFTLCNLFRVAYFLMQHLTALVNYFICFSAYKKKTANRDDDEESISIKQISKDEYEKSS